MSNHIIGYCVVCGEALMYDVKRKYCKVCSKLSSYQRVKRINARLHAMNLHDKECVIND